MSKSWRTEPSKRQARCNIRRGQDGLPLPPRFVVHPPRPGDVHLLDKRLLLALWEYLPVDYTYGLRAIELRARVDPLVGRPFATYNTRERTIRLFSTPSVVWPFPKSDPGAFRIYEHFGASVTFGESVDTVQWKSEREARRFLFAWTFAHELGHHFDHQYKHKWKLPSTVRGEEEAADRHISRLRAWQIFNTVLGRAFVRNDG